MRFKPGCFGSVQFGCTAPTDFLPLYLQSVVALLRARPGRLWENLATCVTDPAHRELFRRARAEAGNVLALPCDAVFPDPYPMRVPIEDGVVTLEDAEMLQALRQTASGAWRDLSADHLAHEFALELDQAGLLIDPAPDRRFDRPGVYRLQHAALLFRSTAGTGVLTDPVNEYSRPETRWIDPLAIPGVDAILVSHSHQDHFSLTSLLQFPRDVTMIVPEVPRSSMLCPDMAGILRDAGFTHVVAAPWYTTVEVKDVTIHVYPFYGEQPWLSFAPPVADLRNYGNTYAVVADGRKTWVLIDTGQEHGHSMLEVCQRVRNDLGEIDLVLSNLREFPWFPGQIDGSGRYLFCFSVEQLNQPDRWPTGLMTFGPRGIHDLLEELEPRAFLPYAHWWQPKQRSPHSIFGQHNERDLLAKVSEGMPLRTDIRSWQVGDRLEWRRDEPVIDDARA